MRRIRFLVLLLLLNSALAYAVFAHPQNSGPPYSTERGCSPRDLMPCVIQMKAQHVSFSEHLTDIVLNITTEAKLINTCKTFAGVEPCFTRALSVCGNAGQRALLAEARRAHAHLCVPTALARQTTLLRSSFCLLKTRNAPRRNPSCDTSRSNFHRKLSACREKCKKGDAMCSMRAEMSQQDACTVITMERECGPEAAQFYAELQSAMIGKEFPVQCQYKLGFGKETIKTEAQTTKTTKRPAAPHYFPAHDDHARNLQWTSTSTARSSIRKAPRKKVPIAEYLERETEARVSPALQGKVREFIDHLPEYQANATQKPLVTKVRSRMFSKMFEPSSGTLPVEPFTTTTLATVPTTTTAATTTARTTTRPPTASTTIANTTPRTERTIVTKRPSTTTTVATQPWLHGARPIPEASFTVLPKVDLEPIEQAFADPKPNAVTSLPAQNDQPLMIPEGEAAPLRLTVKPNQLVPVREVYADPVLPTTKKWIPWYYQTTHAAMPLNDQPARGIHGLHQHLHSLPSPPAPQDEAAVAATRIFPVYALQPPATPLMPIVAEPVIDNYAPLLPITTPTTRLPFRLEVKWIDEETTPSPATYMPPTLITSPYPEYTEMQTDEFREDITENPLDMIRPLVHKLGVQSLNFTDLSRTANQYISAAMSALNAAKSDVAAVKQDLNHEDPWQSLIDTFERVSPNVMDKLREGIDRLGQPNRT